MATRPCPFCREDIAEEAVRCPHCRSRLVTLDPSGWRRDHPDRRVAGVAAAVSHAFAVPVGVVRAGFVVGTFLHFLGPVAYAALWALIPLRPGEPAPYERGARVARDAVHRFWHGTPAAPTGPTA
jgi:phage shock protein PspC (stress-responsive transcriptional regulator)